MADQQDQFAYSRTRHYYVQEHWKSQSARGDYHPFFPRFSGSRHPHPLSNDSARTMGALCQDPWSDTDGIGYGKSPSNAPIAHAVHGHSAVLSRPGVDFASCTGVDSARKGMDNHKANVQALTKNRIAFLAARALVDGWQSSHAKKKAAAEENTSSGLLDGPPERRGKYFASSGTSVKPYVPQDDGDRPGALAKPPKSYGPRPSGLLERTCTFDTAHGTVIHEPSGMKTEFAMRNTAPVTKSFRSSG